MTIRAKTFAIVALGAVCAVQAQAADLGGGTPYVTSNWAGLYAGGTLGYTEVNENVTVTSSLIPGARISLNGSGSQFGLGALVGYNWQHGNQVYGVESDIDLSTGFDYFGTVRGRYGMLAGNWLIYGTGGLAFASSNTSFTGYVIGAGAETKINNHIVAGFEGLYYGLLDETISNGWVTEKVSVDAFTLRGRVTYRFDGLN
jgi:outer membrane immunogenic protein